MVQAHFQNFVSVFFADLGYKLRFIYIGKFLKHCDSDDDSDSDSDNYSVTPWVLQQ